jgi:type IV secretion system protein TrbC
MRWIRCSRGRGSFRQDTSTEESLTLMVIVVALEIAHVAPAWAAPAGAAMPWDAPLTTILDNLQGTVARVLITIAVVLTGLLFAFGEAGGAFKKVFGIAFGGALALGAVTFLSALGFVGATF